MRSSRQHVLAQHAALLALHTLTSPNRVPLTIPSPLSLLCQCLCTWEMGEPCGVSALQTATGVADVWAHAHAAASGSGRPQEQASVRAPAGGSIPGTCRRGCCLRLLPPCTSACLRHPATDHCTNGIFHLGLPWSAMAAAHLVVLFCTLLCNMLCLPSGT